ncbi:bifunctional protein-serine/threonine kinase/phosphatase [Colwellia sp. MB02u-18]|uniref:bifunctional protein-serine/threonine kinase/phosphatase n=1 Tax=unclassified Colwellia TaxID=196834 RepID=UPI0015F704B5|nr:MULTISPECIES: bifunctional protein-serine/threonine kinase/phosphatase [unclassified Colwellia]MBA6223316.1 bifunctional protein-serine/threonine kinase/phosphatase [Colwellia sp. MB3u-45]MBA6267844.1 bifunctional protein-serine/threonine kinase/phosphatase [Colwellia sp. MB3u-43]MBA6322302.1 bifunctional protein-serine/threonine kinase/phosphatase [Colwellia sp. MB02u-19]MBA6323885.1 bifunctional protein-serine/threonine kinase/phosphatase [Colwellia sp. MB02u-18]MBA6331908.1 bifunctional 
MSQALTVSIGGATNKGRKKINQDFLGSIIPKEPMLSSKGIVLAMADGISSSNVSQIASETAISSFLEDYYCTSDSWSVKNSAQKVIKSINSWLYSQTRNSPYRFDKDKGYVCTFTALILKSNTAHLFHSGDTRIYRLSGQQLEQLTEDHRRVVSADVSYLTRALGINQTFDIDYQSQLLEQGDIYIIATDGVYDFLSNAQIANSINNAQSLDNAADTIIAQALALGSDDNLSVQIVRIDNVPSYQLDEVHQLTLLPLPPRLSPRMQFDGYEIIREIYISSRSHVFLARDNDTQQTLVIKTPSTELRTDTQYLERFMLEEWIAKRINNPHVVNAIIPKRKRHYLYLVTEFIDGISLSQWMIDHPKPSLEQVRNIIEQTAKGLQAFHRQDMIHQDLRPANIMIDNTKTVKIIDFGSTFIAGVTDANTEEIMRGTIRYSAPEYFLGQLGTQASDLYSLGVITYQMLSGKFPYGREIAQANSVSAQRKLNYKPMINDNTELPLWIDDTLERALKIDPLKRYSVLSEFVHDLRQPNKLFLAKTKPPLMQRDPVMFWQWVSLILLLLLIVQAL